MPPLTTEHLVVREFAPDDLPALHQLLDVDLAGAQLGTEGATSLDGRRRWLEWAVASYAELAALHQPPYTDRAITLRATGEVIGACGLTPCLCPFGQLPGWLTAAAQGSAGDRATVGPATVEGEAPRPARFTPEVGLFWAVHSSHRRRGYATEAGRALIKYAFDVLQLERIVATTTHDNRASMAVMRALGMAILRNPLQEPPWFQAVGVLPSGDWRHA